MYLLLNQSYVFWRELAHCAPNAKYICMKISCRCEISMNKLTFLRFIVYVEACCNKKNSRHSHTTRDLFTQPNPTLSSSSSHNMTRSHTSIITYEMSCPSGLQILYRESMVLPGQEKHNTTDWIIKCGDRFVILMHCLCSGKESAHKHCLFCHKVISCHLFARTC